VFCTSNGTPINPRNLVRDFKAFLRRANLPDIRFHDLRHSCASLLAAQGVPVRVAMDILGHTNIATTQNIYTHVFDDAKRQAADAMDQLFRSAREAS
jgi:integrase